MSDKDPLAQLNEHFARFLQHADGLLREWRSAIDAQTKDVQRRVAREVDAQLEQQVGDSLRRLRDEVDRLTRAIGGAGARRPGSPAAAVEPPAGRTRSCALAALVSANVLLVAVLALGIKQCAESGTVHPDRSAGGAGAESKDAGAESKDAPTPPPDAAPAVAPPADAAPPDAAPAPKPKSKSRSKPRSTRSKDGDAD
jgi:hypothetical protein